TAATYNPDNALTGFISGSSGAAAITNRFSYNTRLQPCRMTASTGGLPTTCADTDPTHIGNVFDITYDFHVNSGNNGNVWGISNNRDGNRSQIFVYDALNRLLSAWNQGTDCSRTIGGSLKAYWGNDYTYDAWGNLTNKTPKQTACSGEGLLATADSHNWLHATSPPDYRYDAAGNMTFNATPPVQNYTFDEENRLTGAAGYTYTY